MSSNIIIPEDVYLSEAEREDDQRDVREARWLIDHNGATLPVTKIYRGGERISDPIMATSCVAYDLTSDEWLCLKNLTPGDVWSKSHAQVRLESCARHR